MGRPTYPRAILTLLGLVVAYAMLGRLSLLLAIPPGYATAIWPPAGLALAGVLVWGPWVWPGIWLGSFLVNFWPTPEATSAGALLTSLAIPASIGLGAAAQGLVGAWLIRHLVGFPSPLDRGSDIVAFLGLGGPLSCLINATWGVTTLFVSDFVPWPAYVFQWWTWWVGDTLGVLIVTPLVLIWTAEPRSVWRRRRLSVAVPLGLTCVLAIGVFVKASAWEQEAQHLQFQLRAKTVTQALTRSLHGYLEVLYAIESFFASSQEVSRQEFQTFVQRAFARYPGLQALSWSPRVLDAQREAYEEAVRQEGSPHFQITERDAAEALEIILKAWTEETVTHEGKYWQFDEALPVPKPYQKPHPPVWFAAHSPTSLEYAARHNFHVSQNLGVDEVIAEKFALYRSIWRECGHAGPMPRMFLMRAVHVAETDDIARAEAEPSILKSDRLGIEPLTRTRLGFKGNPDTVVRSARARGTREQRASYDWWVDSGVAVVGSPQTVRRKLVEQQARCGYDVFCANHRFGGMPLEQSLKSLKLFGEEVIPAFT